MFGHPDGGIRAPGGQRDLEIRLVEGLPVSALGVVGRSQVARLVQEGLVEIRTERLVLTPRGRLLADAVVRDLVD